MPNWVEGKLKVRGKPEDIGKWATECLHCYITRWIGNEPQTEIAEKAIRFEHEPSGDEMYLNVDRTAYIEGTERNFIEEGFYNNLCKEDGKSTLVVRMKAAWGIEVGPYIEMSKKYNLDFRVYGYECGMEFNQEIEIIKGETTVNREIEFEDYCWERPDPMLGG